MMWDTSLAALPQENRERIGVCSGFVTRPESPDVLRVGGAADPDPPRPERAVYLRLRGSATTLILCACAQLPNTCVKYFRVGSGDYTPLPRICTPTPRHPATCTMIPQVLVTVHTFLACRRLFAPTERPILPIGVLAAFLSCTMPISIVHGAITRHVA